jgi:ribose/xylose/arabinose/galactoside ABC-type transport system permease subunit
MKLRLSQQQIPAAAALAVLLLLYSTGCLLYPRFGSLRVLVDLFGDSAFLGIAAVGTTFVILSGGIDLSVGSVVAFTGILVAQLVAHGVPPLAALAIALLFGAAFGALMGTLIHFFELPSFLVTLGGMFLARGLGFVVHAESLPIAHPFYDRFIAQTLAIPLSRRLSLPFTAVCLVAVVVAATALARWTRFGRNVYALGSSEASARLMGLPVGRTKILVYALAGLLSALGGCVATFYMQSGNPASFVGLELDAIAAAVIGGTMLRGGVGFIPGTLVGVLILGLIQTLITFQGDLNSWWTRIIIGGLLFVFILLQELISRFGRLRD